MRTTNSGVPQGTVLGPPCFNAAYSDQVVETERYVPVKFADDNNQCVGGKNNSDDAQAVIRQQRGPGCESYEQNYFQEKSRAPDSTTLPQFMMGNSLIKLTQFSEIRSMSKILFR